MTYGHVGPILTYMETTDYDDFDDYDIDYEDFDPSYEDYEPSPYDGTYSEE